ncbi:MAG: prepilin-type N-terminal cleavage/methylation domain-containing protein [Armatimonadetes bacterium]|nr:prepilin-type N-terminal cleavage/methylation domain-containing protein [Armatimonadota bacterium]
MIRKALLRAFTLIELLVVIAIIAILAAILFPVFAQAKDAAKQTQCIMQMRQLSLALVMYADDHEGFWAPVVNGTQIPGFPPQQPWIGYDTRNAGNIGGYYGDMTKRETQPPIPGKIDSYLKSEAVKKCPKRPEGWQLAVAYGGWPHCDPTSYCPYGGSSYWYTNPKATNEEYSPGFYDVKYQGSIITSSGVNDGQIEEPSNTIMLWEHGAWVPTCNFLFGPNWFNSPPNDPYLIEHFHFLHRDAAIACWTDSHVRRMPYGQLKRPMFSVRKDIYR